MSVVLAQLDSMDDLNEFAKTGIEPEPKITVTDITPKTKRRSGGKKNKTKEHAENIDGYFGDKSLPEIYKTLGVKNAHDPSPKNKNKKKAKKNTNPRTEKNAEKEKDAGNSMLLKLLNGREITLPVGRMAALPEDVGVGESCQVKRNYSESDRIMQKLMDDLMKTNPIIYDGTWPV